MNVINFFQKIDDTMFMIEQISDLKDENDIYFRDHFTYNEVLLYSHCFINGSKSCLI